MISVCKVTDLADAALTPYYRLSEPELMHLYEPDGGVFIAETPMIIERALEAGFEPVSMLVVDNYLDDAKELLGKYCTDRAEECRENADAEEDCSGNCNSKKSFSKADRVLGQPVIYTACEEVIAGITGFKLTRGMLAAMRRKPLPSSGEFRGYRRIAVLEDVMNPTNVGAIFRSAAALGVDAILLTKGCSDPLYRRACRVGMGTCFLIPWTYLSVTDGDKMIDELHELGYKTVAMALRNDTVSIDDPQMREEARLAILLGTEGEGLRTETVSASDYTVKIPMTHGVDSLNVAAASAVVFWELTK